MTETASEINQSMIIYPRVTRNEQRQKLGWRTRTSRRNEIRALSNPTGIYYWIRLTPSHPRSQLSRCDEDRVSLEPRNRTATNRNHEYV